MSTCSNKQDRHVFIILHDTKERRGWEGDMSQHIPCVGLHKFFSARVCHLISERDLGKGGKRQVLCVGGTRRSTLLLSL